MNEFANAVLGLIALLVMAIIVMLLLVAVFRPSSLPLLIELVQKIGLAMTRKLPDAEVREKRKNDDVDSP